MSKGRPRQKEWTDHDSALWYTWDILTKLHQGESQSLPLVAVPFAMQLGGYDERILASHEYAMAEWSAVGDGSYLHNGGFLLATGGPGVALSAAVLGARAIGNAKRKRQAIADSQPRWVWNTRGCIHVSTHGFYLQTPNGLLPWSWPPIDMTQMVAPATVWIQGQSDRGRISWLIRSIWAELVFVLWALARNPHHPQLIDGSWLPPGWPAWAAEKAHSAGLMPPTDPPEG